EQQLAELFGPQRIMGGLAFVCINRLEDGVIHHLDHGLIQIGEYTGGPTPRLHRVAELFNTSRVRCQVLDDLAYGRWEKLVWNIPFNGLGAALDLSTDRLLANPAGEGLVLELMTEKIAKAKSLGMMPPAEIFECKIEQTTRVGSF